MKPKAPRGLERDTGLAEVLALALGRAVSWPQLGPYTIVARLGEGPRGLVFRARERQSQRLCNLVLLPELRPDDPPLTELEDRDRREGWLRSRYGSLCHHGIHEDRIWIAVELPTRFPSRMDASE